MGNDCINSADYLGMIRNRINVYPFEAFDPNEDIPREATNGDMTKSLTGKAGYRVKPTFEKCCCPNGENGHIVLTQLIMNSDSSWQVDANNEHIKLGQHRLVNQNNTFKEQIRGYRDSEWDAKTYEDLPDPNIGRRYSNFNPDMRGFTDAPGLNQFGHSNNGKNYTNRFRVESYCRCESTRDYYTGDSVEFDFERASDTDITISNVNHYNQPMSPIKLKDYQQAWKRNPSKYPSYNY